MVSTFREYYSLVEYFSQFRIKKLRVVIGVPTFINFLEKKYYTHLRGGLLEAMGKFFIDNMKLYVYPTISSVSIDDPTKGEDLVTSKNMMLSEDMQHLYQFLIKNRMIIDITDAKKEWLWINSQIVIRIIKDGAPGWEAMVPKYIEQEIKRKKLFGYNEEDRI
jgi:hypothetical protein